MPRYCRVSQLKEEGMPVHTIEAAKAWRLDQAKEKGGSIKEQLDQARIKLVKEQETRIKIQNEEARGVLISRGDCREAWTRLGAAISKACQMAAKEIPQVCLGLPISQALPLSKAKMSEIQRMLSDHESEFWNNHKEIEEQ